MRRVLLLGVAVLFVSLPATFRAQAPAAAGAEGYKLLRFRHIGPAGNRVAAVVGVPDNPYVYYIGAASGGIFKTIDGGTNWTPVFDDQPAASIGSLAVARSAPNIVWAGTGEAWIRSNVSIGNGIYKSVDSGRTWTHVGLENAGRIGRIVIDPHDPDVVLAAVMGHSYGPQPDRGVYRTRDGGKTWEKVLFVDENTGACDVAMDPNNPQVLVAGMWQLVIHTWGRESGGPGSGLYMSRDGGTTWKRLSGHGLPDPPLGKIGIAIAPNNSNRVYALIETKDGGLWRSDDGGENWTLVNQDHTLDQRPHYYTRLVVSPANDNEVWFPNVDFTMSLDGGRTYTRVPGEHGDDHDLWIDPTGSRLIVGNDDGAFISVDHGRSWFYPRLPIAQMYHVYTDNQIPYNVYGNRQDGPSARGPSNSRLGDGTIPIGLWHDVGGCESGFAIPDPADNNIVWSDCYDGTLDRYDESTREARSVTVWPENVMGSAAADLKYRFQWTTPIAISPHDHNTVYVGSQFVHKTTDGGQSWTTISPDLTLNDKSKQGPSGGLTPDNASVEYAPVVFAIAESPVEKGLIWAGTNDGQVQVTRDGAAHWTNVTAGMPGLPPLGTVSNIEPSKYDAGAAYVTVDLHQVNNRDPFVYKTTDYGKTWKSVSGDVPKSVFSYAHCVREDPVRKGMLYLGTENGLYVSFNDGAHWQPLQNNLPHAPVYWLTIQETFDDLVVATYGRGFWILDDIHAIRELTPQVTAASVHLFAPRQTYRFRNISEPMSMPEDPAAGRNAPYGAALDYYLQSVPSGEVAITILDAQGNTVRRLTGKAEAGAGERRASQAPGVNRTTNEAGINRVWWDLRYDATPVRLRTPAENHPHATPGPEGWRPLVAFGVGPAPLVPPGTYTVKLSVAGHDQAQKLVIKKDPNTRGTDADVQAQAKLITEMRGDLNTMAGLINQLEWTRKQLADLKALLSENKGEAAVVTSATDLDRKLLAAEGFLFQTQLTGADEDGLRWPGKLYEKIGSLIGDVGRSDFRPTNQQIDVFQMLDKQVANARIRISDLLSRDVMTFNQSLRGRNISNIIVTATQP